MSLTPEIAADIVVAGAGHNSLITAAYLAKAGYEVVVLEARPSVGGGAVTEELTIPGFRFDAWHNVAMELRGSSRTRSCVTTSLA